MIHHPCPEKFKLLFCYHVKEQKEGYGGQRSDLGHFLKQKIESSDDTKKNSFVSEAQFLGGHGP